MRLSKQTAGIVAAAGVILTGSAGAWALSGGAKPAPATVQVADDPTVSAEPTSSPSPTDSPTTVVVTVTATASETPSSTPNAGTPTPTSTKKAAVSTPTDPAPTTPAAANQQTQISVDQGPYPSQGPADPNAPTGNPNSQPSPSQG